MSNGYAAALERLDNLQSNYAVLSRQKELKTNSRDITGRYSRREKILHQIDQGKLVERLQKIPLFHVAGTKGKGTTAAMTEVILRRKGFKTGLFTSPHLVKVNERIRINGKPIDDQQFSKSFHHLYDQIGDDKPAYFAFLTITAFYTFAELNVDVVILEVGIGGQRCPTSTYPVGPKPRVCCITSLGYDHMSVLGHTIQEISAAKAGIFREGATLISSVQQYPEAHQTLLREAKGKGTLLTPAGSLIDSIQRKGPMRCNATVAITATRSYLGEALDEPLTKEEGEALDAVYWPGRQQITHHDVNGRKIKILLDGAHTIESARPCVEWASLVQEGNIAVLLNITKDRDVKPLIDIVSDLNPLYLLLSPNVAKVDDFHPQIPDRNFPLEKQLEKINEIQSTADTMGLNTLRHNSIDDALKNLPSDVDTVLITGSLYLVGAYFSLRPDLPI